MDNPPRVGAAAREASPTSPILSDEKFDQSEAFKT